MRGPERANYLKESIAEIIQPKNLKKMMAECTWYLGLKTLSITISAQVMLIIVYYYILKISWNLDIDLMRCRTVSR